LSLLIAVTLKKEVTEVANTLIDCSTASVSVAH